MKKLMFFMVLSCIFLGCTSLPTESYHQEDPQTLPSGNLRGISKLPDNPFLRD